jgi:nitrate/TMAO reductase-like tetraheme cytochrome c subunit
MIAICAFLKLRCKEQSRAAQRAHELAKTTGTTIVISHDGIIGHLTPKPQENSLKE